MIKAIIFDLDNTLIDFVKMKKTSCEAAIDAMIKNGLKISRAEGMKVMFELYDKKGWEYQKIFQMFLKRVAGKIDYRIMGAGIAAYRKAKEGLLYSYPNVLETLTQLKSKYKLAVITDAPGVQAWIRLNDIGLQNVFDVVITYGDSKKKKPDLKPFKMALNRLSAKPSEAVMVGDRVSKDITPAKTLGITTVLALYGKGEIGEADYKIKSFKDLVKIF